MRGKAERHRLHDIGAGALQRRFDPEQSKQVEGEQAEDQGRGKTEQQSEGEASPENVARLGLAPAAIRARGEDEDPGEAGKAHDEHDEGHRAARPERRQLRGAVMADHGDVDQVHQGPVEAGQHDRPGQAQDAPGLVAPVCCQVVLHGGCR